MTTGGERMFNYENLTKRYHSDAAFNRLVNLWRQLIEEYGFLPDELRQAAFLAQMHIQLMSVEHQIRCERDIEKEEMVRKIMQQAILDVKKLSDIGLPDDHR